MPQFPKSNYSTGQSSGIFVKAQGSHTPMVEADLPPPIILPEYYHPFKVYKPVVEGQTVTFSLFVGNVYGVGTNPTLEVAGKAWSVDENNISVAIGDTVTEIPGTTTPRSGFLDERNVGMRYSGTLDSTHDTVLFVEIMGQTNSETGMEAKLHMRSVEDANQLLGDTPPDTTYISDQDELHDAGVFHFSGPPEPDDPFVIYDVNVGNGTTNIELGQNWGVYKNVMARSGRHHIPIAYFRQVDADWNVRQVLRSDIFFPYGTNVKIYYIDTFTDQFYGGCSP